MDELVIQQSPSSASTGSAGKGPPHAVAALRTHVTAEANCGGFSKKREGIEGESGRMKGNGSEKNFVSKIKKR